MSKKTLYRVQFLSNDVLFELYAHRVSEGNLFGFIEIEDILFGERSSVVVDPSEERLRGEFQDVQSTFIPIHDILRIDQVEKMGKAKAQPIERAEGHSNVSRLPNLKNWKNSLDKPEGE